MTVCRFLCASIGFENQMEKRSSVLKDNPKSTKSMVSFHKTRFKHSIKETRELGREGKI